MFEVFEKKRERGCLLWNAGSMGRLGGRSWVPCGGGYPVNSVAKFGDFRRHVVEVLQGKRCVGSVEEK